MEAVVHQSLGDVIDIDAGISLQWSQIEDAFMGNTARGTTEQHREVVIETVGQIIGRQQRHGTGLTESIRPHHP